MCCIGLQYTSAEAFGNRDPDNPIYAETFGELNLSFSWQPVSAFMLSAPQNQTMLLIPKEPMSLPTLLSLQPTPSKPGTSKLAFWTVEGGKT